MLAVGREGLETALFIWAATKAAARDSGATSQPLIGAILGILVAVGLGYLMYRGALRINLSRFFTWTGAFLILVAAGVLAYGIHDLQEAGFLPGLHTIAFDVSHIVSLDSLAGTLLKGIFNFSPVTTVLEAIAWVSYVVIVGTLFALRNRAAHRPAVTPFPKEPPHDPTLLVPVLTAGLLLSVGCTDNTTATGDERVLTVQASDTGCAVSATTAPSGTITFKVTNEGSQINEFYLLGRTACGSSPRSRTSAPVSPATWCSPPLPAATSRPASPAWSARASAQASPSPTPVRMSGRRGRTRISWPRPTASTPRTCVTRSTSWWCGPGSSPRSSRAATTTGRVRCMPRPASTGSGWRPSRRASATSTRRWTPARPTWRRATTSRAGTGWRRTSGRSVPRATPHDGCRAHRDRGQAGCRHAHPA
nr:FTR1 family protein [Tessaracoccus coleopterorum]